MFNHVFESIVANYNAGALVVSDVHTGAGNYAAWTVAAKNAIDGFAYPSTAYNKYGSLAGANGDFKGWTNPDDIYIMATADWINSADVNFLATLFNIDRADLRKRIIKVIDFGYDAYKKDAETGETVFDKHVTTDISAMIFDRRMLHFTNDLEIDDTFYNPETLVTNYYKHWWATYQLSPFANCIVFTKGDEPAVVESIEPEFTVIDTAVAIDDVIAEITVTPEDIELSAGDITVSSAYSLIEDDDSSTFKDLTQANALDYIGIAISDNVITITSKVATAAGDSASISLLIGGKLFNLFISA